MTRPKPRRKRVKKHLTEGVDHQKLARPGNLEEIKTSSQKDKTKAVVLPHDVYSIKNYSEGGPESDSIT